MSSEGNFTDGIKGKLDKMIADGKEKKRREIESELKQLRFALKEDNQLLIELGKQLQNPPILITLKTSTGVKKKWHIFSQSLEKKRLICEQFNQMLLSFGSRAYSLFGLLLSTLVGIYWLINTQGIDFIAGNTVISVSVFILIIGAIDLIGYQALVGLMLSLRNLLPFVFYKNTLELIILSGFALGAVTFFLNIYCRLQEVGI